MVIHEWHSHKVPIYKILVPSEWQVFQEMGQFGGSPLDLASGFIHCSSKAQVSATAARFFPNESIFMVLELDVDVLSDTVRWEPASNGETFPHVYGSLPIHAVIAVHEVADAALVDELLSSDPLLSARKGRAK